MRWAGEGDPTLWPRLIGDIGGTNARLAYWSSPTASIGHHRVLPCADFDSIAAAIEHYLQVEGVDRPQAVCLGIANPVTSDAIRMTNHVWEFSIEALRKTLSTQVLLVLNDFTALALALPHLGSEDLLKLDNCQGDPGAAIGILGPGTGLGVSGLIPTMNSGWAVIAGEGGHITLAAHSNHEHEVLSVLRRRYGHVSAERVLSGPGLVDLYHALLEMKGSARELVSPAEVLSRATEHPDSSANEALEMFTRWLGSVAGDLALTLGARGGVYIGGGIAPRIKPKLLDTAFRQSFEAKGRFQSFLQSIPLLLITSPQSPALRGAAQALSTLCHDPHPIPAQHRSPPHC